MTIGSPVILVVGLVVVAALVVLVIVFGRRRARALAAAGVTVVAARRVGVWLSVAGLAVLAVAASSPSASVPVPRSSGTVILAMDVSASMGAKDVAPSRLKAAQKAATAFVTAQPTSIDIGVVAFQSGALTTLQPTANHADAVAALGRLSISGSTSVGDAILGSLSAITGKTVRIGRDGTLPKIGSWESATIVLFSDGENEGGTDVQAASTLAEDAGVHIETVGVGTTTGTTITSDGYSLHTALDPATLQAIATTTGGSYHPASDASQLDGLASTVQLRLTVAPQLLPLAGALSGLAILLLAIGAVLTVWRTGRIV